MPVVVAVPRTGTAQQAGGTPAEAGRIAGVVVAAAAEVADEVRPPRHVPERTKRRTSGLSGTDTPAMSADGTSSWMRQQTSDEW